MALANEELAYAAGIIDGEGCIYIDRFFDKRKKHNNPNYVLRIRVAMTDFEVPEWLEDKFGGVIYLIKKDNVKHRDQCAWSLNGRNAAEFLKKIETYTKIKLKQIKIGLEFEKLRFDNIPKKGRYGFLSIPPEILTLKEALWILMHDANQRR